MISRASRRGKLEGKVLLLLVTFLICQSIRYWRDFKGQSFLPPSLLPFPLPRILTPPPPPHPYGLCCVSADEQRDLEGVAAEEDQQDMEAQNPKSHCNRQ